VTLFIKILTMIIITHQPLTRCSIKPKLHLVRHVTSRHDSTRSTCRACPAVLFQHGGRRTSYSARLYKFGRFYALTYTNPICSVE